MWTIHAKRDMRQRPDRRRSAGRLGSGPAGRRRRQRSRPPCFSLNEGEMFAIIGPSGSGKSTLMHLLGLLHQPDGVPPNGSEAAGSPRLVFNGRDVTKVSDGERTGIGARDMGFAFQDFNLVPTLTALENVYLACDYAGRAGRKGRKDAVDALAAVGLADRGHHRPTELSGGEQQRVAIARALVNRPRLVLADEPTGNLDSERAAEIMGLLTLLNRGEGLTLLIVTHEPEIGQACDRVVRMRDGRIVESGAVATSGTVLAASTLAQFPAASTGASP